MIIFFFLGNFMIIFVQFYFSYLYYVFTFSFYFSLSYFLPTRRAKKIDTKIITSNRTNIFFREIIVQIFFSLFLIYVSMATPPQPLPMTKPKHVTHTQALFLFHVFKVYFTSVSILFKHSNSRNYPLKKSIVSIFNALNTIIFIL